MRRGTPYLLTCCAAAVAASVTPALAQDRRADIAPYIDVSQVVSTDLSGNDDTVTYTSVSAGVDASVQTRRVQVSASYRYEHRFSYDDNMADLSIHSGLARAAVGIVPGLTLEGGAIATRTRFDIRGDAPDYLSGDTTNITQVYSFYGGPSLSTHAGPVQIGAGYRIGYTRVDAPDATGVTAGQTPLDVYDDSTTQQASFSVGTRAGTVLPVGLTVNGAWEREDAGQLDQRYEGRHIRGDVVLPVARTVALVGGVGYEKVEITQRDPLLDGSGQPVTDSAGRQVTDPASPRRIAYDLDGIFWDAGVVWRPSTRTTLEARVGRRYDSWSYTGSLNWQIGPNSALQIGVYDGIDSFARQLNNGLSSISTDFTGTYGAFGGQFNGCIFGTTGDNAGTCMNGVFQSVATANYRARGVDAVLSFNRGRTRFGVGAGYARRDFLAPDTPVGYTVYGITDESLYAQAFAARPVGPYGMLSGNVFLNYYNSGLPGADSVLGWGVNGAYSHRFGRLDARAALGIYGYSLEDDADSIAAQALLGLHYGF